MHSTYIVGQLSCEALGFIPYLSTPKSIGIVYVGEGKVNHADLCRALWNVQYPNEILNYLHRLVITYVHPDSRR